MDELNHILKTYIDKVKAKAYAEGWNACAKENGTRDAEPEIIRCEGCKWCEERYDTDGSAPYWICKNWDGGTDADGFCHEAERKIDE